MSLVIALSVFLKIDQVPFAHEFYKTISSDFVIVYLSSD